MERKNNKNTPKSTKEWPEKKEFEVFMAEFANAFKRSNLDGKKK